MKIIVTRQHIIHGKRESCTHCPIALAALEAFHLAPIFVDAEYIKVYDLTGFHDTIYPLPPEARQFIADFDHFVPVQPFEFEVEERVWKP